MRSRVLDLTLDIPEEFPNDDFGLLPLWQESQAKIIACQSLRSLTLSVYVTDGTVNETQTSRWSRAVSFLSHVPPQHLTAVHFILEGHVRNLLQEFYAGDGRVKLASVLSRIPNLQSVLLTTSFLDYMKGYGPIESKLLRFVEDVFVKALPRIAERGALKAREDRKSRFRVLDGAHTG